MINILKNRTIRTLSSANFFETLGISIFNIVLITYAQTFPNANIFISIVSIASVLPSTFGVIIGRMGDYTPSKGKWLFISKIIQAILYIILAQIIDNKNSFIFMLIIFINIISDTLGVYSTSLRMPIIQNKIDKMNRQQAIGFNQSISTLIQPLGQTLGVTIIEIYKNYALAGYINALTFIISAIVLFIGKNNIAVSIENKNNKQKQKNKNTLKTIAKIFNTSSGLNVFNLIASFTILNAVGGSIDAILNLYLLQNKETSPFSFGISVLLVNIILLFGTVFGNLNHRGYFDKIPFKSLETIAAISFSLVYINLLTLKNFFILLILLFFTTFCLGKLNPRISKNIMDIADPKIIGSIFGILGTITTISLPIGSIGLVLIYNVYSANAAYIISIIILIIGILTIITSKKVKKSK